MTARAALFVCEHGKRDDEDCLGCEILWEERMIVQTEASLAQSKATLKKLRLRANSGEAVSESQSSRANAHSEPKP